MLSTDIGDAREFLHDDVGRESSTFAPEVSGFSLVLGGPLFQLLPKFHLEGNAIQLLHRRVFASILLPWFPLLVLSAFGNRIGGVGRISFFHDIEVHARFLVALPILIGAEFVRSRIRPLIRRFIEWRIALPEDMPLFHKAIASAVKVRNSISVALHERQHHGGVQDLC
jgi:hypothetical protein